MGITNNFFILAGWCTKRKIPFNFNICKCTHLIWRLRGVRFYWHFLKDKITPYRILQKTTWRYEALTYNRSLSEKKRKQKEELDNKYLGPPGS